MNDLDDQSAHLVVNDHTLQTTTPNSTGTNSCHQVSVHERLELYRAAIQTMAKTQTSPSCFVASIKTPFAVQLVKRPKLVSQRNGQIHATARAMTSAMPTNTCYLSPVQGDVGQFCTPRHIIKVYRRGGQPDEG